MSGDRWWTCTHDGIGLPGCPTCDGRFPGPRELSGARNVIAALGTDQTVRDVLMLDAARGYLRDARDEIARLTAERDAAARILAALRALPPETVGDVRRAAARERSHDDDASYFVRFDGGSEHTERAARLTALADRLDEVRRG